MKYPQKFPVGSRATYHGHVDWLRGRAGEIMAHDPNRPNETCIALPGVAGLFWAHNVNLVAEVKRHVD